MFREIEGVAALWGALERLTAATDRPLEIRLVDDGSDDGTGEWLEQRLAAAPQPGWRLLRHAENRGLTAALRTGSEATTAPWIGWLDADLTYPAELLPRLLDAALANNADLAMASCHHPQGEIEGVPAWRGWLSRRASGIHRLASRSRLHTFTCMVRVQRRELLLRTWPQRGGFVGVTEQLLRALATGALAVELPATLHRRKLGISKMQVGRAALGHLGLAWDALRGRLDPA